MLKFSGFTGLTSCLGEARNKARFKQGLLPPRICKKDRATKALDNLLPEEKRTQYTACAKGSMWNTLTHKHAQQHHRKNCRRRLLAEEKIDSEADMLSGISRKRNAHSSYYWFSEFCNSQCLSHFAAPFIGIRAKTSIAESCN